jgi:hypothetical protein
LLFDNLAQAPFTGLARKREARIRRPLLGCAARPKLTAPHHALEIRLEENDDMRSSPNFPFDPIANGVNDLDIVPIDWTTGLPHIVKFLNRQRLDLRPIACHAVCREVAKSRWTESFR